MGKICALLDLRNLSADMTSRKCKAGYVSMPNCKHLWSSLQAKVFPIIRNTSPKMPPISSAASTERPPGLDKTTITMQRRAAAATCSILINPGKPKSCRSYPLWRHCYDVSLFKEYTNLNAEYEKRFRLLAYTSQILT